MLGLLVIDKPLGITSHDVVARIRRVCQTKKVGHAGTLDPLASGVLLVCVGRATRLIEYLVGHDKGYEGIVRFGQTTNTYDAEGEVTESVPVPTSFGPPEIEPVLSRFRGPIEQVPPIYSAIKKDGQPLYKLARAGKTVDIPPRPVTIHQLEMLSWASPDATLSIECASGTYIRSLAHDLGRAVELGGHLVGLRRTSVGRFTLADSVELDQLTPDNVASYLHPPESILRDFPSVTISAEQAADLKHGRWVAADQEMSDRLIAAYGPEGRFVGIIRLDEPWWKPEKMFV